MTDWRWNETAHRYVDAETGRFISHTYALSLIQESIRQAVFATDTLAGYVSSGQIAIPDWTQLMRTEIKNEYIRQYLAGIGGRSQMTQADWGRIGNLLREQYRYLDGFSRALPNLSEAQIRVRAALYMESAGNAYEKAHALVAKNWGADEVSWIVDKSRENCPDCLDRQQRGPQPIGPHGGFPTIDGESWPKDGTTVCLVNCGCMLSFSNSVTGEVFEE